MEVLVPCLFGAKHSSEAARARDEEVINSTLVGFGLMPGKEGVKPEPQGKDERKQGLPAPRRSGGRPTKKRRGQSSPAASFKQKTKIWPRALWPYGARKWLLWEDEALHLAHEKYGGRNWKAIAQCTRPKPCAMSSTVEEST